MFVEPALAALVKERGPSHPHYAVVIFSDHCARFVAEGKIDPRQPRDLIVRQARSLLAGEAAAAKPSWLEPIAVEIPADTAASDAAPSPFRQSARRREIFCEVARRYGLAQHDLLERTRKHNRAHPRQELFYRLKVELDFSLAKIGRICGGLHHTTVLHGIRQHCARFALPLPTAELRLPTTTAEA